MQVMDADWKVVDDGSYSEVVSQERARQRSFCVGLKGVFVT